jgi:hypothetical protein
MIKFCGLYKEMKVMLSESKLTNSHALPFLFYLQDNLKNQDTDTYDLRKMKSLLRDIFSIYYIYFPTY